jgi:hypothetical protein
VTVSAGKVALTVTNKHSVEHTLTLDERSSSTNLLPGKTVTITHICGVRLVGTATSTRR